MAASDVTIVIATRDRRARLLRSLERLGEAAPATAVVVVDDASSDGTAGAVAAAAPGVQVVTLRRSLGAAARNVGAAAAATPLVAFCDDDSWWAPGALDRAAARFASHPRLGLVAARVLVGDGGRVDPTCRAMACGPQRSGSAGPAVCGFVACGAVVRRTALLGVGGFEPRFGIGGEEALLAFDLMAAGWTLAYADDVVAHHHPESGGRAGRSRRTARNDLWTAWLRRPVGVAASATVAALRAGEAGAVADAARGLPWVLRRRRALPAWAEREVRRLSA